MVLQEPGFCPVWFQKFLKKVANTYKKQRKPLKLFKIIPTRDTTRNSRTRVEEERTIVIFHEVRSKKADSTLHLIGRAANLKRSEPQKRQKVLERISVDLKTFESRCKERKEFFHRRQTLHSHESHLTWRFPATFF
jgi:hypothetical protein